MKMKILILLVSILHFGSFNNSDDCYVTDDCDMVGSVCEKRSCSCQLGFVANSLYTECLVVAEHYGSFCSDNIQCSTSLKSGGLCSNGTCICSEGYHYYLGKCWKSAGLGENCRHNENCFVSYDFEASICNNNKVCECSNGYYQREYSSCRRKSYNPGDPCGIYLDCKFENAYCSKNRTCNKNEDVLHKYVSSTSSSGKGVAMLRFYEVGGNCTNTKDCPKNSKCNQRNICSCEQGFYFENNICKPELGASCTTDEDCFGKNTICQNGTYCACKQGFVASVDNHYCDKMSRYLGWSCLKDRECGFFGPDSVCNNKKCRCDSSTHYVDNFMYCWVTKNVGDSCYEDEDCGGVDLMTCTEGICGCSNNTHPSSDKKTCRDDTNNIGDKCVEDLDCKIGNSFCSNNICQCVNGYVSINGSCVSGVGGKCENNIECYTEGTSCVDSVCTCQKNFVGSNDFYRCLKVVHDLNGNCSESVQCVEMEGTCVIGKCLCLDEYHYVENTKCFKSRFINEPCTSNGNCSIVAGLICSKGICECEPRFTYSQDQGTCSRGNNLSISRIFIIALSFILILNV